MYSTNITDNQWQVIEKNINVQERKKRQYLRGCGRGVCALARRMPDQISDAPETMDCRALFLLARELPQTHHRLRISGQYRRDDCATRLLGNQFFTNLYKQSVLAPKCNLKQNFICHILDKSCIQSSNLPVRYTNFPIHTFLQQ